MRKSPPPLTLPNAGNSFGILAGTASKSREIFEAFFDANFKPNDLGDLVDNYEITSEEYIENPSIDNLFRLAVASLPISRETAIIYCNMVLEKYYLHEEAREVLNELTRHD